MTRLTRARIHRPGARLVIVAVAATLIALVGVTPASAATRLSAVTATITSASSQTVTVTWKNTGAKKYTVVIAGDKDYSTDAKRVTVSAKTKSVTIALPTALRGGKGKAVFAKVYAYNGAKMRQSTKVWTFPAPSSDYRATRVTIASYNVCLQCNAKRPYLTRATAIKNAIVASGADIVGVQEATTLVQSNGKKTYRDLADRLAPYGYALTYSDDAVGTTDGGKNSKNAHVLYKTSAFSVIPGGSDMHSAKSLTSGVTWKTTSGATIEDKWFGWAELRHKASGKTIFVVSIHLPTGTDAGTVRVRAAITRGLIAWIAAKNSAKVPTYLIGDLNSSSLLFPTGAQKILTDAGYYDSIAAKSTKNLRYGTSNANSSVTKYQGFPPKPVKYTYFGGRIDYIFSLHAGTPLSYETQIITNANGTFNENYRGSDHNLVKAVVTF